MLSEGCCGRSSPTGALMTSAARGGVPVDASTRFRAPTYVRNVIERRRLLGMLRAGSGRQLVVIHAPAGYGKTTLAVQWLRVLEDEGGAVAWLGLHRDDNDPHWFLSHLLEAVAPGTPGGRRRPRRSAGADRAERRGHPALHALRAAGADRAAPGAVRADLRRLAPDRRPAGAPRAGPPAGLRAAQHGADPHQPYPPAPAALPAAGPPPADRGRRRDAALRRRRDPRVPRRPERAVAARRRRRAALREHGRLGRGPAARVAVAARLRRSRTR